MLEAIQYAHPTERLPNTLKLSFPAVAACHASGHAAMEFTSEAATGAVRLSLGRFTSLREINAATVALIHAWKSLTA